MTPRFQAWATERTTMPVTEMGTQEEQVCGWDVRSDLGLSEFDMPTGQSDGGVGRAVTRAQEGEL